MLIQFSEQIILCGVITSDSSVEGFAFYFNDFFTIAVRQSFDGHVRAW